MSQQKQLLQEYVQVLERENQAKNKQRQTLYGELEQLQQALKSLQQQLALLKLNKSTITTSQYPQHNQPQLQSEQPSPTSQSLKSRIRDLQQQLQILKYQQQHLFEQNLSLITALEGTANHNTQLQKQNIQLKSQKQQLQKFRLAIERISASLQQLESQRQQLTQANIVLVEENSYLKGVLAGSTSSYRHGGRNYCCNNGGGQEQFYQQINSSSNNINNNSNTYNLPNYPIVKSSYLMSSSFQKISQYEQQYQDSTQGGGSKRKHRFISSTKKDQLIQRDTDRDNEFMYQHQDNVNENDQNDESSYLMVMIDEKSKQSLRVSYEVQQQQQQQNKHEDKANRKQSHNNNNNIEDEQQQSAMMMQDLRISNFDRVNQHSSISSSNQKNHPPKLSSRRSPTTTNKNDQSSCDVIQQQLQSQHSQYHESINNNNNNKSNYSNNLSQNQQQQLINNYNRSSQQQQHYHYNDKIQKLQIRNSQLQTQLMQLKQRFIEMQRQRDTLYDEMNKREQQEEMTVNWWETKMEEMTNNYNAVVQHAQQLEEQNVMYKNRIVQLEALVKEFNYYKLQQKNTLQKEYKESRMVARSQKNINNFVTNKNINQSTRKRFSYHYEQHQSPNNNLQNQQQSHRPRSVTSMKELRQIDTNDMVDHKSLLKHNNQLIERMTQIQQQKNQLYYHQYFNRNQTSQYSLRSNKQGSLRNVSCKVGENDQNKENFIMNHIVDENIHEPTYSLPKNKRHLSQQHFINQPTYSDAKVNNIVNSSPFERSFTKACKKFNRTNKKPNPSSPGYENSYQNDHQNSEIKQVENRLQRRIERIKSQNQLLLKQLQLF